MHTPRVLEAHADWRHRDVADPAVYTERLDAARSADSSG